MHTLSYYLSGLFIIFCLAVSPASASENKIQLNDTGIYYSGGYPKGIDPQCDSGAVSNIVDPSRQKQFIRQQDCATGVIAENKNGKQSVFHYQKIAATGDHLSADASQWQCVIDEVSGLMWEVKQQDSDINSLHHAADKFTWYNSNPTSNGGNIGDWNQHGVHCYGFKEGNPRSYCHVEQFVSRVNKQGLCGYRDWRLPTRPELASLIHFGAYQPAIDNSYFPNTLNNFYWTLNPVAGRPIEAWAISFEFGFSTPLRKTDVRPARLVRDIRINNSNSGGQ